MDVSCEISAFVNNFHQLPEELLHVLQNGSNSQFLDSISAAALHPNLTEHIFSYFQPLAFDICARWAGKDIRHISAAFGRILDIFPHLSELAQRLLGQDHDRPLLLADAEQGSGDTNLLRESLLAVHRLLNCDNASFARLVRPAKLQLYLQHADFSIRCLALRVLCQYLHASDAVLENMKAKYLGTETASAIWEDRTIDYIFLPLWEEKRHRDFRLRLANATTAVSSCQMAGTRVIGPGDLHPSVAELGGVLLLCSPIGHSSMPSAKGLVSTPTTLSNLRKIAEALHESCPILLTGLAGCGKTSMVKHTASILDKASSMITLHLNEQSDAKLLIGVYTTGAEPGSFEWQPGVLTTAVREGRWVLVEDLDRAPNAIVSTLLPLIERGELLIPSRGEKLQAAAGFKIFATMRSTTNLNGQASTPGMLRLLGRRLWNHVSLDLQDVEELESIIEQKHPVLKPYMMRIMAVYHRLTSVVNMAVDSMRTQQLRARPISPRELFKWTSRISAVLGAAGVKSGSEAISESVLDAMFLDAYDCFVSNLEDHDTRILLASWIAEELHIDSQRRDHLLRSRQVKLNRPTKSASSTDGSYLRVGRAAPIPLKAPRSTNGTASAIFSFNGHSLRLLEQVAVAVGQREPLLLVGETGIGKTAAIQHLSTMVGQELVAINLSQQSESGDLLGGFKPINVRSIAIPLKDEFDALFGDTLSRKKNAEFLARLSSSIEKGKWKLAISLWRAALQTVEKAAGAAQSKDASSSPANGEQQAKRRKIDRSASAKTKAKCVAFAQKLDAFERQSSGPSNAFRFAFAEGNLVKAVRHGHWVLLDEINLASSDTLESLSDLLESGEGANPFIILSEAGSVERIEAHPNFRIFAAMNPASDVGKKDLPIGIRSRFTEIYVESPDKDTKSLESIIHSYLERALQTDKDKALPAIVTAIYQNIQRLALEEGLVDGAGQRPHFSLRTLTRTLSYAVATLDQSGLKRALYEGFCMCFFTSLDPASEAKVQQIVQSRLFGEPRSVKAYLKKPLRPPHNADRCVEVSFIVEPVEKTSQRREEKHWISRGRDALEDPSRYIITPYIARNLRNLIRATSTRSHPVLIQGPTSAGKTSMVEYLAQRSGNKFVRINNHEHTDLQEYLGTYVSNANGQLLFQEGVLVKAVREGHWVVLDELNLAPTDVLEALNRLLDDNRELLIPETQEVIKPHPDFMLFATQNPAGPYGGRKVLSRAFRNRFIELHFDDIPVDELNIILSRRSQLPESWCRLIVEVYRRLSRLRQEQRLFEQDSFATLRDLFRWAFRGADTLEELAGTGYMLLAEKIRKAEERDRVKDVLEQVMSRKGVKVQITEAKLYTAVNCPEMSRYDATSTGVIWTSSMRRLYTLVSHAIRHNEPVLLVGETGCGKTTVCQMLAHALDQRLHIVNAHQNTETGDLIGSQRPIRNRAVVEAELLQDLQLWHNSSLALPRTAQSDVEQLLAAYDSQTQDDFSKVSSEMASRILVNRTRRRALFEWADGSLVQAMRSGQFYLLDEISLADDSVLERMNSVLDPNRSLLLAEKGGDDSLVVAADGFQFFATMNPGGDYGKKELSPALRNRFTEIWVPALSDTADILQIAEAKLKIDAKHCATHMVEFAKWFGERFNSNKAMNISTRDILAWIDFVNASDLSVIEAVVHGAAMVFVDTLGANPSALLATSTADVDEERRACLAFLGQFLKVPAQEIYDRPITFHCDSSVLRCGPFSLNVFGIPEHGAEFDFDASTARQNALRIVRALQLPKPVLLEGNPGVGKTSIVIAIAKATGRRLVRINLSEQTDLMDLFGSDVPVEGAEAGNFTWRDAPFLQAMKRGDWVLLDEMNLASQSVLEGLNACLDHRGEVYISELDQTFARHPNFKLFAAQNPHHQGGGRKGFPASFVNRFTVVYADMYQQADLELICSKIFPTSAHNELIKRAVAFVADLDKQVAIERRFGARGSPWEFNLRDTIRWLTLLTSQQGLLPAGDVYAFFDIVFAQRFRSDRDITSLRTLINVHFSGSHPLSLPSLHLASSTLQVGLGLLARSTLISPSLPAPGFELSGRARVIESLMICVQQKWPVILVGPSGAGKSMTLQALACTIGAELETFALNADIDATDLVGGYEQADAARDHKALANDLIVFCLEQLAYHASSRNPPDSFSLTTLLFSVLEEAQTGPLEHEKCHKISSLLNQYAMQVESEEASRLKARCVGLAHATGTVEIAKFEWLDGVLVKALEQGRWLVLDNANLCSSSVLDRLNALLEPAGSLVVSEHCNEDGTPKTVQPHPNFRIFLTMDPQYGELSRAMRNRAVELYMPARQDEKNSSLLRTAFTTESSLLTLRRLINVSNITTSHPDATAGVVQLASESLSIADNHMLSRFATQVDAGLLETEAQATISNAIQRYEQASLLDSTYLSTTSAHYSVFAKWIGVSDDYAIIQPMHPFANTQMVLYEKSDGPAPDTDRLGKLCDIFLQLTDMSSAFNQFRQSSAATQTMTRLARSLASDRLQNVSKDTTLHVGSFLLSSASAILDWVRTERLLLEESSKDFETTLTFVTGFLRFWRDIFDLTNSTTFQEAIFQTYLSLGDALFLSNPMTKTSSPRKLQVTIKEQFDRISSTASRTTGLSMERMWQVYKPTVPKTFAQLLGLQRLLSLAKNFGGLMWSIRAPVANIAAVQSLLRRAYIAVVFQDAEPAAPIHDIDLAIASLQTRRREDTQNMPYLQPIFEGFCRLRDLNGKSSSREPSRYSQFELLASRDRTQIDLQTPMDLPNLTLTALSNLDRQDIIMNDHPIMFDRAHLALLKKFDMINDVDLQHLELLQTELDAMTRFVAVESSMICSKPPDTILGLVLIQLIHLLEAHELDISSLGLSSTLTWQDIDALLVNVMQTVQSADIPRAIRDRISHTSSRIQQLCSSRTPGRAASWSIAGKCMVEIATLSLWLFVPDRPYDPALQSQVVRSLHVKHVESLERRLEAFAALQQLQSGISVDLRSRYCQEELQNLVAPPSSVEVARPPKSRLNELQVEFANVLRITKQVQQAVEDNAWESIAGTPHSVLLDTLDTMASRLEERFPDYADIVIPVAQFLGCLRTGLALIRRGLVTDGHSTPDWGFEGLMGLSVLPLSGLAFPEIQNLTPANFVESLTLNWFKLRSTVEPVNSWSIDSVSCLIQEFDRLHGRWQVQLEKDQRANQTSKSLYEFKGDQTEDDETLEREFEELFPSFVANASETQERHKRWDPRAAASMAASLHMAIFLTSDDPEATLKSLLRKSASRLSQHALASDLSIDQMPSNEMARPARTLPALFLVLKDKKNALQNHTALAKSYSIYTDANIAEVKRLLTLVYNVEDRFRSLVETWPEHAALHTVLDLCKELLETGHAEPIMKFMPKVEQLHVAVTEWQSVASREFSVAGLLDELSNMIIKWRELELATWGGLLDLEDSRTAEDAKSFWFLAYGSITAPEIHAHIPELLKTLQDMIGQSTLGQFAHRLSMLRSLSVQLSITSRTAGFENSLSNAIVNLCDYFRRFQPLIDETIAKGRAGLEKSVKEVAQLARWEGHNVEALKQSAKASHRKLFRIVKKYRELLSQPVLPVLSHELPSPASAPRNDQYVHGAISTPDVEALRLCQSHEIQWRRRPNRFRDTQATAAMIRRLAIQEDMTTPTANRLDDFTDSLEASIAHLQKATPSTLTEDNATTVKHLTARKRRLFADTLKELRQMGLKSNPSVDLITGQNSLSTILASLPPVSDSSDSRSIFLESQSHLHLVIDSIDAVRRASTEHHEDLSANDAARSIGLAESLLAMCLHQRAILARQQASMTSLDGLVSRSRALWNDGGCQIRKESEWAPDSATSLEVKMKWLPTILRVGATVLAAQAELGALDFEEVVNDLREGANRLSNLQSARSQLIQGPDHTVSTAYLSWTDHSREALRQIDENIGRYVGEKPQAKVVFDHLIYWLHCESGSVNGVLANGVGMLTLTELDMAYFDSLDTLLGSIQDVERSINILKTVEDEKEWLVRSMRTEQDVFASFRVDNIVSKLNANLAQLTLVAQNGSDNGLQAACASFAIALPILEQYQAGVKQALRRYAELHRSTCRTAYRLTKTFAQVAKQGFCKPAEPSNEKGGSTEQIESGTGLGDGEGAEDISKDIGDDEDLTELAQDENNQKKDGGMDNQDDAVNIEDALEGAAGQDLEGEDAEKEKGEDQGDEDDADMQSETGSAGGGEGGEAEEGKESADNEVGDVDDLAPSAVDEKMWDEAGDESKKEKAGKESSKSTGAEQDVGAEAEGKEKDGQEDEVSKEDDGSESNGDTASDPDPETSAGREEAMVPHVQESEGLDLPEDMQLDGDKVKDNPLDDIDDDDHLDDLDDIETSTAQEKQDEADADSMGDDDETSPVTKQNDSTSDVDEQETGDDDMQGSQQEDRAHDASYGDQDPADGQNEPGAGTMDQATEDAADEQTVSEALAQGAGPDDTNDEQPKSSSAAQRQSGEQSESAQTASGSGPEGQAQPESSSVRNKDQEMIKKLGDVLEKWHRQRQEILPAETEQQRQDQNGPQEDTDMSNAQFEHLPDDDAEADTQALGASTKEQAKALDDRMETGDDGPTDQGYPDQLPSNQLQQDEDVSDSNVDMNETRSAPATENAEAQEQTTRDPQAFVGDRKEQLQASEPPIAGDAMMRDGSDSPSPSINDEDLNAISLETRPTSPSDVVDTAALWQSYTSATHTLSITLTEQLRLILAPTLATKLRGDFRTGKRLNIKRIIPYIASSYKRDKIWMRRSVPSKRAYQVMLAIDDSGSMGETVEPYSGPRAATNISSNRRSRTQTTRADLAFSTLALLTTSLTALEVGDISVLGFGSEPFVAHDFNSPFTPSSGPSVLQQFTFQQRRTDVRKLLETAIEQFAEARTKQQGGEELWQLMLIVGDGICEDHEGIRRELVRAQEERILVVFIIVDQTGEQAGAVQGSSGKEGVTEQSILDLETVDFVAQKREDGSEGEAKLVRKKYLDTFPFQYYLIVRDVRELPGVLATALRQWFAEVSER